MTRSATAKVPAARRATLKVDLSRELAQAIAAEGIDQGGFAEACGVDDALVQRWTSPRCLDSVSPADIVLAGDRYPELALQLLRWCADPLGHDIRNAPSGARDVPDMPKLVRDLTATMVASVEGEADGILTPSEISRELELLRNLMRVVPARIAYLQAGLDAGGITTRRT